MDEQMRDAVEGAGASLSTSEEADEPQTPLPTPRPKVVHLYYGSEETVTFTPRSLVARYAFTGRPGGKISVVADGPAPVNLVLLGKDPNDTKWRAIATASSLHSPTIFDTPTALRTYRLQVTAADIGDYSLKLGCETEDTKPCAVARQPSQVCSDSARTAAVMNCDDGLFCELIRHTCGQGDQGGRCLRIPSPCSDASSKVCGCDGETYANECRAHAAGVSIWREGDCRDNPRPWDE